MKSAKSLTIGLCAALVMTSRIATAQVPAAGDLDPNGRVLAKVSVTITEPNAYGHPISGLRFLVAAENGDRISIRTDDAGMTSAWLRPGSYRFVTPDPLAWQGTEYTWDVVVAVRPGTGIIRLSQANASKVVVFASPGTPRPAAAATVVPAMEAVVPDATPTQSAPPISAPPRRLAQTREGVWFNIGLGYGVLGCKDCSGTIGGLTGGFVLGGTLNQRFQLGLGTTGWTKSENGATLTVSTLDARLRFYPSATGGFFLTGGIGVGSIGADVSGFGSASETGLGVVVGLGMDFRVGENLSLTPFWNGIAIQASNADANVGQIGLGLTFH
jgi:Outer membrane protein beta-barrel domain